MQVFIQKKAVKFQAKKETYLWKKREAKKPSLEMMKK